MACENCKNEDKYFGKHRIEIKSCSFFEDKRELNYFRIFLRLILLFVLISFWIYLIVS